MDTSQGLKLYVRSFMISMAGYGALSALAGSMYIDYIFQLNVVDDDVR